MYKLLVCSLSFFIPLLSLQASDKQAALVMKVLAPKEYGEMRLNRYRDNFSLSIGDQEKQIPNYMVSKPLRQMEPEQLSAFLKSNYISVKQCSDGNYAVDMHGRVKGGGLVTAAGGCIAGEVAGKVVVYMSGYVLLFATKKVIGVYAGKEAERAFDVELQNRFLPRLWDVSDKIAHIAGAAGAVIGGVATPV